MKLYLDKRAPNPRRVRIFLAEKGLDDAGLASHDLHVERVDLDIGKGELAADWFVALQPLAVVPVLAFDDGRVLRESIAICRWFEETVPTPSLFGLDAWERAEIEMWNRHAELELFVPIMHAFRHGHAFWAGKIPQVAEYAAVARAQAQRRMAWLDRELADREYLAPRGFSVADITALCALDFGKLSDLRVTAELPNLHRWYQQVSGRPSARA